MRKHLFKRLVSGALALLMLGTALPAGNDFTGLFSDSDIVASAADAELKCCDIYAPTVVVVGEMVTVRYVFAFDNDIDLATFSSYEATKYEGNKSNEKWTKSYDDRKHTWTITYTFRQEKQTNPSNKIYVEYPRSNHNQVAFELITAIEADGKCGDNAFWCYDNHQLNIFGSGDIYDYDDNNPAPWHDKDFVRVQKRCCRLLSLCPCSRMNGHRPAHKPLKRALKLRPEPFQRPAVSVKIRSCLPVMSVSVQTVQQVSVILCSHLRCRSLLQTLLSAPLLR